MRTNFRMEDEYITMVRGDTLSFNVELLDENENPFTNDLDTAYFSCKLNKTDNEYLFQKSIGNGITKTGANVYAVRVDPNDTKGIEAGKYFYDLQLSVGSDVFTFLHGVLEIEQDVTW